ncbi:unnamed protein product [Soboliphyme baturini]|uniref:G patch domain-containing protein 4 n=1 Tax=Soboliphyme baturini TaxID=241478 RepID=A0A183J7R7_9BILA|nr:unnamed protein product [Soboliphyme baturini]
MSVDQIPWSEDTSNIGRKLMEKMGWKNGRGLGNKEQGIVNNISLVSNKQKKGIGFEGEVQFQDNFDSVLSSLQDNAVDQSVAEDPLAERVSSRQVVSRLSKARKK